MRLRLRSNPQLGLACHLWAPRRKTASILTLMVERNSSMYSNPKRANLSLCVITTTSALLPSTNLNILSYPFLCVFNPLANIFQYFNYLVTFRRCVIC
jgi:hypothetical protein